MSEATVSDWKKGGLRYQKLQEKVPAFLAPTQLLGFFVAVRKRGGKARLLNPFTPFQREYVIAATNDGVAVLRLRRPGVFRASIAETVYQAPAREADVDWRDGKFVVGRTKYQPIAFHQEDAERVAQMLAQ
jgi:hypothetical protein